MDSVLVILGQHVGLRWVGRPLFVIGLIVLLELSSNMVMEPLLYGQSASLSAVALLVAIAFWTWLWWAVGLLLATPLTVCLECARPIRSAAGVFGVLMGDESPLETDFWPWEVWSVTATSYRAEPGTAAGPSAG